MAGDTTLDYIPEYLAEDAQQRLRELAKESAPEPAPLVVNEYLIRHWCETLEDANPLYLDPAYAKSQGLRSVIAPLGSIMTTFSMQFRWPWPPPEYAGREPAPHIHYDVKAALNLPVGIIQNIEVEAYAPLQVGDRISVSQRLVSVSPWKKTRLGEGHFWTMDRLYRNQHGEQILRERMSAFGYGRTGVATPAAAGSSGGWSPAVEEAIRGNQTGYSAAALRQRWWAEIQEGDELPALRLPITVTRCVYLASATRDFSPQHSNRDYAQHRSKTKDVFVNTPFNVGMVGRFLTDWAGPRSIVRRMSLAMRGNVCAGDDMILTGTITRKYIENGEPRVDVDIMISTQDGPLTPCKATLAVPGAEPAA